MQKEGFAVRGGKPLKLIQLDCKKTKQYNYDCNFKEQFYHLAFEVKNYTKEVATLFSANLNQNLIKQPLKLKCFKNFILFPLLTLFALTFSACASKPVYKVEIKEVFIPVKCNLKLPTKPKENGSFASHRALAKYYLEVEQIAKDCSVTSK